MKDRSEPFFLEIINGREPAEVLLFRQASLRLGRCGRRADLVFDDPSVSRIHAEIFFRDGRPVLRDSGSLNGTFFRGESLRNGDTAGLAHDDEFRIGDIRVRFLEAAFSSHLFTLVVEKEGDVKRAFGIDEERVTVGRSAAACDIILNAPYISGKHAEICLENGRFVLKDLHSVNGISRNGTALEKGEAVRLRHDDTLQIADFRISFFQDTLPKNDFETRLIPNPAPPIGMIKNRMGLLFRFLKPALPFWCMGNLPLPGGSGQKAFADIVQALSGNMF